MQDLRQAGYVVDWRAVLGEQEHYDLCVLDLGLPGRGGLEGWCRDRLASNC